MFPLRYLGKVAQLLEKVSGLEYVHSIAVGELIARSTKHVFTAFVQVCVSTNSLLVAS